MMVLELLYKLLLPLLPAARAWTINVPSTCPSDAAGPIDPTFQAFAFEIASFAQYVQTTANDSSPNQFTLALMDEIVSRTGGHPVVRIGGTSADYAHYEPGLDVPIIPVAEFNNLQLINFTLVGPDFYKLTHNLASLNATFIVQVPLAINNISEPVAWAEVAIPDIGWEHLDSIEIGNEPAAYGNQLTRYVNASSPTGYSQQGPLPPSGWKPEPTNSSFANDTVQVVQAIISGVPIASAHEPIFQPAGQLQFNFNNLSKNLDVPTFFEDGINQGGWMNQVAGHFYQAPPGNISNLGVRLMNHSAIVREMSWVLPYISYLNDSPAGSKKPLPFDMNEVGNSVDAPQNFAFQASMGSALWQVDYQLYLASIGVRRINWQQIMRAVYGMWLPRDSGGQPAQVYSNFYAMPFVGDFIGKAGNTRISQLDISQTKDYQNTVAYMAYDYSTPARMAIVNLNEWPKADMAGNLDTSSPRGAPVYDVTGLPPGWAEIRYLNTPEGAHGNASSMTYGGSQWTYASGGREVKDVRKDSMRVWVGQDGAASVTVWDSSAAMVVLGS